MTPALFDIDDMIFDFIKNKKDQKVQLSEVCLSFNQDN